MDELSQLGELGYVGKTICDFLATFADEKVFEELYSDGASVRVIFREALPPVAQQFVMRLAFGGARPFQEAIFRKWCRGAAFGSSLQILQRLQILRLAQVAQAGAKGQVFMLHKKFQVTLVNYLKFGIGEIAGEHPDSRLEKLDGVSEADLLHHAVSCWDAFLEELTSEASEAPDGDAGDGDGRSEVMTLATALQLLQPGENQNRRLALTSQGFQFILDERQQQLWSLILMCLNKSGKDQAVNALKMIFALGELKLGQRLVSQDSQGKCGQFLQLLQELGILYASKDSKESKDSNTASKASRTHQNHENFYVTPAGLALFKKDSSATLSRITGSSDEDQGIIVESNFKVYCYTSQSNESNRNADRPGSSLHVKLLSYFCEIFLELPKLVVAQLTADSILKALKRGIRVANIVRYLEAAAHPRSTLPSNVKGQLEVWESSRSRAATSPAVLFEWQPGDSDDTFLQAEQLARDTGSLLWSRRRAFDLPPVLVVQAGPSVQQIRDLVKPSKPSASTTSKGKAFAFRLKPEGNASMDLD